MTSPISIVAYSSEWPFFFTQAQAGLLVAFDGIDVRVEHIGSTAVPGLAAKPTIDVLRGADSLATIESRIDALQRAGYQYVPQYEADLPMRRYFFKGADLEMLRVNLHAVELAAPFWRDHVAFRDALRADAALLGAYCSLKIELAARFPQDLPSYTAAKTAFIRAAINAQQGASAAADTL